MGKRAKNKGYGHGGIYPDAKRPGHFIIRVPFGHSRSVTRRAADAKTAERVYAEILEQRKNELNPDGANKTLQALSSEWWERVVKPRQETSKPFAPKTLADYRDTIEKYLLPKWGTHRLHEITALLVVDMFHALRREYSEAQAHRVLTKLHMLLEAARRWRYVKYNAVEDARKDLPPRVVGEKIPLTIEETLRLFLAVTGHRLAALYHVALTFGLRAGELLGLQWGDVDWKERTITIRRQVQEVKGKQQMRNRTKGYMEARVLPLPPHLFTLLAAEYEKKISLYIFPNDEGREMSPSNFARHFRGGVTRRYTRKDGTPSQATIAGVRLKAKLPSYVTLHTFRHTVSTRLMEMGTPEEIRAAILGHGKKGITQHYSHATLENMRTWLERLEREVLRLAA